MKTRTSGHTNDIRCLDLPQGIPPSRGHDDTRPTGGRTICPALDDDARSKSHVKRVKQKKHDDLLREEALQETFPASDPPSSGHFT